jgi:hypothetical protein
VHVLRQRKNSKEDFDHDDERKVPRRKTEIYMGITGWERCYTEERKNMGGTLKYV